MSKKDYHADYEASRMQTFISKLKYKQLKKSNKKIKEPKDEIKKLRLQLTNQNA